MKISLVSIPVEDPIEAHDIYTNKLGFQSKEFDADSLIAIVVSPDALDGTGILLEPCGGTFAETYKRAAYDANLPIMVFETSNLSSELDKLSAAGVVLRPDLDRPDWGLSNLFEDGCGNLLMLQESAS